MQPIRWSRVIHWCDHWTMITRHDTHQMDHSDWCAVFLHSITWWRSFNTLKHQQLLIQNEVTSHWFWFSQEFSEGLYKHVIGRPILHMEDEDSISMAFLYSPPPAVYQCQNTYSAYNNKSISLGQQMVIAMCLTLLFQFIVYIYKKIWSSPKIVPVPTKCSQRLRNHTCEVMGSVKRGWFDALMR